MGSIVSFLLLQRPEKGYHFPLWNTPTWPLLVAQWWSNTPRVAGQRAVVQQGCIKVPEESKVGWWKAEKEKWNKKTEGKKEKEGKAEMGEDSLEGKQNTAIALLSGLAPITTYMCPNSNSNPTYFVPDSITSHPSLLGWCNMACLTLANRATRSRRTRRVTLPLSASLRRSSCRATNVVSVLWHSLNPIWNGLRQAVAPTKMASRF